MGLEKGIVSPEGVPPDRLDVVMDPPEGRREKLTEIPDEFALRGYSNVFVEEGGLTCGLRCLESGHLHARHDVSKKLEAHWHFFQDDGAEALKEK